MALDIATKERLSEMMKGLWTTGKIVPKKPWNKGLSTRELGKARPVREIENYVCENCGKKFTDWRILKRKYCSRKCLYEFWKRSERYNGENNPAKSLVVKQKISKAKKGIPSLNQRGEKHWNWQGGKSFEPYGIEFNKELKEEIKERDNYTCQLCNEKEKLVIHHIDYCKKNNKKDNLITLCRRCNTIVNKDRIDWMHFFKEKLSKI